MIHIVLFQPEIPHNTGNIGRMCALTHAPGCILIHPLGFEINESRNLRPGRDGLLVGPGRARSTRTGRRFARSAAAPKRLWLFTTKTEQSFGRRGRLRRRRRPGLRQRRLGRTGVAARGSWPDGGSRFRTAIRICARSISSTAYGIACYEALRQIRILGARRPRKSPPRGCRPLPARETAPRAARSERSALPHRGSGDERDSRRAGRRSERAGRPARMMRWRRPLGVRDRA